jgi:hypothetical protein
MSGKPGAANDYLGAQFAMLKGLLATSASVSGV